VIGFIALVAGCGGNGGTSVDPGAPVISNLVTAFLGACTTGAGAGRGRRLTMNFTDTDGNVSGGKATVTASFDRSSGFTVEFPIPSATASISGTTAGVITLSACATYGGSSTLTETIRVTDASGKVSNELTATTPRPPGFPQLPTPSPTPMWGVPEAV
jgi:hypothetical protein